MAERNGSFIDTTYTVVPDHASIGDVVGPDVRSVATSDGRVIGRDQFLNTPIPPGFERNLTPMVKG